MVLCGRWEVKEGFIDRELFQLPLIEKVGISQIKRKEWAFKKEGMACEKARRHKRNRKIQVIKHGLNRVFIIIVEYEHGNHI